MRRYIFLIVFAGICLFIPFNVFAWSDNSTHPAITEKAAGISALKTTEYLKDRLGFDKRLDQEIVNISILEWLKLGARTEDTGIFMPGELTSCSRGLNHFFDPSKTIDDISAGLNDWVFFTADGWPVPLPNLWHWTGKSNFLWARGDYSFGDDPTVGEWDEVTQKSTHYNVFSWKSAREVFREALRTTVVEDRNMLFARMFRSVGQVSHLLEDMSVPAHVRNDMKGHMYYQQFLHDNHWNPLNWMGNNLETYVQRRPELVAGGTSPSSFDKLEYFWDTDKSGAVQDWGLAEYTQNNFFSEYKLMGAYDHPNSGDGSWEPTTQHAEDGKVDIVAYFMGNGAEPRDHLLAKGYLTPYCGYGLIRNKVDFLDDTCFADYAKKLLPKAIGYSAGLINYFFRGTLGVTEANVFDWNNGSITKIKAQVINTTPNNENAPNGEVFAFVRYKTDPKATEYSYAVSANATDDNGNAIISIGRNTASKMTFDFSGSPIPGNAIEMYLHVVYYGDLGNELGTGIAIGMHEVKQLYVLLSTGDNPIYYSLYSVFGDSQALVFKNPLYGLKNQNGSPAYPDAQEFYQFPEDGVCWSGRSECPGFNLLLDKLAVSIPIDLFQRIGNRSHLTSGKAGGL